MHAKPDWSPHPPVVLEDVGLRLALLPWPGIVGIVYRPRRIEMDLARAIQEPMLAHVRQSYPDADVYDIVHDWSQTTGYDSSARVSLTRWTLANRRLFRRAMIVPSSNETAIMRLGITTAALALRPLGLELELIPDVQTAIEMLRADH